MQNWAENHYRGEKGPFCQTLKLMTSSISSKSQKMEANFLGTIFGKRKHPARCLCFRMAVKGFRGHLLEFMACNMTVFSQNFLKFAKFCIRII